MFAAAKFNIFVKFAAYYIETILHFYFDRGAAKFIEFLVL